MGDIGASDEAQSDKSSVRFFEVTKCDRSAAVGVAPLNEIEIGDLSKTNS